MILVAAVTLAHSTVRALDCKTGEAKLDFMLYLDEDSLTENGWSLTCESVGTIWTVPIGTLQSSDPTAAGYVHLDMDVPYVNQQVCLSDTDTCDFTLVDSHGDGLLFPGYFYLFLGSTTIALSEPEEEFLEKSYCLGTKCTQEQEIIVEDCDSVYLLARADENFEQNTISIQCDGETLFERSFTEPEETIELDQCVPTSSSKCCTLSITDSAGDGLNVLDGAQIYAEWASNVVLKYDDPQNAFEFDNVKYNFGLDCPEVDVTPTEDPIQSEDQSTDEEPQVDSVNKTSSKMSKQDRDGPSGAIIACAVVGSLLLIGLLVLVVIHCATVRSRDDQNNASISGNGKDMEIRSQGTEEIDVETMY